MKTNRLILIIATILVITGMLYTGCYANYQVAKKVDEVNHLKIQNDSLRIVIMSIKQVDNNSAAMLNTYQDALALYRLVDSAGAKHFEMILEDVDTNE